MTQQIPDSERIPSQVVEDAIKGLTGKARWEAAARVGEDWGYGAGFDAGREWSHVGAEVVAADVGLGVQPTLVYTGSPLLEYATLMARLDELTAGIMVACPDCGGTGKLWNGSQCKRCYGATVVRAVHRDRGDGTPIPELDGSSDNAS